MIASKSTLWTFAMARRGFFAEIQHQSRLAARERQRQERQATQNYLANARFAEQAKKIEMRAEARLAKATESERKRYEKEAREAHLQAMEADVLERNGQLEEIYGEIDLLLASSLAVDDYIDLNSLRITASHPPFDRVDLEAPLQKPKPILDPSKPVLELPKPPAGIFGIFGKKKYAESVEVVKQAHEQALIDWQARCEYFQSCRQAAEKEQVQKDAKRLEALNAERARYANECAQRDAEAAVSNKRLDELIANLGYGAIDAVQEYVSIVLSNSVYPSHFQVTHEFEFDPASAELRLQVLVPGPNEILGIKAYKYVKASDEISTTPLSQKESRDRYAGAVQQVALRSFHEVFESDRRGLIKTVSLEVGTNAIDPATGQRTYVPFVVAGAEREVFLAFDLSSVVPALTLGRLGASVSKNPFALVAAERSGVRRS